MKVVKILTFGSAILRRESANEKFPQSVTWKGEYCTYIAKKTIEQGDYAAYVYSNSYHPIPPDVCLKEYAKTASSPLKIGEILF